MNLVDLKGAVAAYHHVEVQDLIQGPVDLFLVAANNARKNLEKFFDFEDARCTAILTIDGVTGGALKDAVVSPPDVFSRVKKVIAISGLRLAGEFLPVDFTRADISIERDRYELELSNEFWPGNRYPSDAQFLNRSGSASLVLRAGTIYNYPRVLTTTDTPFTAYIEGYGWLKDYTEEDLVDDTADPQDFLVDIGFEYLQWSCIIELNYHFHTFVPRQEGNVGSPENMRQVALRNLTVDDAYSIDPNSTRSR